MRRINTHTWSLLRKNTYNFPSAIRKKRCWACISWRGRNQWGTKCGISCCHRSGSCPVWYHGGWSLWNASIRSLRRLGTPGFCGLRIGNRGPPFLSNTEARLLSWSIMELLGNYVGLKCFEITLAHFTIPGVFNWALPFTTNPCENAPCFNDQCSTLVKNTGGNIPAATVRGCQNITSPWRTKCTTNLHQLSKCSRATLNSQHSCQQMSAFDLPRNLYSIWSANIKSVFKLNLQPPALGETCESGTTKGCAFLGF